MSLRQAIAKPIMETPFHAREQRVFRDSYTVIEVGIRLQEAESRAEIIENVVVDIVKVDMSLAC